MNIIFMGTPEFAVPSMEILAGHFHMVAVITAPDKPAGRGKQLRESDVKIAAAKRNIPVLQPTNLKSEDFIKTLHDLNADLFVVVAFRMLPEVVWSMPPKGTINLHGSLLPHFRGAAPINRAIMQGETRTGLTTFFIEKEIDTGKIIDQATLEIGPDENAGHLHDRMMEAGAGLLLQTVQNIASGNLNPKPQNISPGETLQMAPKIFREDCEIDWNRSAQEIHNHVRGLSPFPAAWTQVQGEGMQNESYKILGTQLTDRKDQGTPGAVWIEDAGLFVKTGDGWIEISELQAPGKKRMNTPDFLRGFRVPHAFKFGKA